MNQLQLVGALGLLSAALGAVGFLVVRRNKSLAMARKRLDWGDARGAARLFEKAGDKIGAARAHARAGDLHAAIPLFLKARRVDEALESMRGQKGPEVRQALATLQAAGALDESSRMRTAAEIARLAGLHDAAAELLEKTGESDTARLSWMEEGRNLLARGRLAEAAQIFERCGEPGQAGAALLEAARRAPAGEPKASMARQAAEYLRRAGERLGAAEALALGGDLEAGVQVLVEDGKRHEAAQLLHFNAQHVRAAEIFAELEDFRSEARAWSHAGEAHRAAQALERAGDTIGAARLLLEVQAFHEAAQVHLRAGSPAAAAEILLSAGDLGGAVQALEQAGDIDGAVEMLCKAGKQGEAAQLLRARGEHQRATQLLADSGDLLQRAQLLEGRGDAIGAAQAYLDFGQPDPAYECLVTLSDPPPLARFLLARAAMGISRHDEAAQHFAALLDAQPQGVTREDILYGLARAFEAADRLMEAVATLDELVGAAPSYRDASFRLKLLRARLTEQQQPLKTLPPSEMQRLHSEIAPLKAQSGSGPQHLPPEWAGGALRSPAEDLSDWASSAMAPVPAIDRPRYDTVRRRGVPSRYAVEVEIGRGGMGVVYRALDANLGRLVAIKVLEGAASADPKMREYFLREARAIAQLVHPNIVTLFDAGLEGDSPYLVMELVEGEDLRSRLTKPIALPELLVLLAGVASGLDYAHGRKIVHRDVKPENVLVSREGVGKLMDFGVAYVARENQNQGGRQATIIGTPAYMAPEQIKGEGLGGHTDVYALGVMLYECLAGKPPFAPEGALYHHVNSPVPDPRTLRPDIPAALAELALRCLAKSPADRPPSARAVADALEKFSREQAA